MCIQRLISLIFLLTLTLIADASYYEACITTNSNEQKAAKLLLGSSASDDVKKDCQSAFNRLSSGGKIILVGTSRLDLDNIDFLNEFQAITELKLKQLGLKHIGYLGDLHDLKWLSLEEMKKLGSVRLIYNYNLKKIEIKQSHISEMLQLPHSIEPIAVDIDGLEAGSIDFTGMDGEAQISIKHTKVVSPVSFANIRQMTSLAISDANLMIDSLPTYATKLKTLQVRMPKMQYIGFLYDIEDSPVLSEISLGNEIQDLTALGTLVKHSKQLNQIDIKGNPLTVESCQKQLAAVSLIEPEINRICSQLDNK